MQGKNYVFLLFCAFLLAMSYPLAARTKLISLVARTKLISLTTRTKLISLATHSTRFTLHTITQSGHSAHDHTISTREHLNR